MGTFNHTVVAPAPLPDSGDPLDITQPYTADDLLLTTVPATGGPFVTGAPQSAELSSGTDVLLRPLADIAANTLTDPLTAADMLLMKLVDTSPVPDEFDLLYPGDGGTVTAIRKNMYYLDEEPDLNIPAGPGLWFDVGRIQANKADFDDVDPAPFILEEYVSVESTVTPGTWVWSLQGEVSHGGDTRIKFHASERLQVMYFTLHDRRPEFKDTRTKRFSLTDEELIAGNADWIVDHANATLDYTHRLTSDVNLNGAIYQYKLQWKQQNGEYEFDVYEFHGNRWSRYGAIDDIAFKYYAVDPIKATWQKETEYLTGSTLIGPAPAGVTETEGAWYVMEALADRPNTILALDATEWNATNWTFSPLVATKQDVTVSLHDELPDPATVLVGSQGHVTNDGDKNGTYTAVGADPDSPATEWKTASTTLGKNLAAFPVGAFLAEFFQDDISTGVDGSYYPDADPAVIIALPSVVGNHGKRVMIATDWAARAATVPTAQWSTETDTNATFKLPATGFPADGHGFVHMIVDEPNNQWVIVTAGDVTLDYVAQTFDNLADTVGKIVPGSLFVGSGTGDLPQGIHYVDANGVPIKD